MTEKVCVSCKKATTNIPRSTSFKCPKCGAYDIVRCGKCREIAAKYKCPNCEFEVPN